MEPNQTFTPHIHPPLQLYLRSLDIDKDSTQNPYEKHDKELSELSERVVNKVWQDVEELSTVFEYPNGVNQDATAQENVAQTSEEITRQEIGAEESDNKINLVQEEQKTLFKLFDQQSFQELREKSGVFEKEIRRVIKDIPETDTGLRSLKKVSHETLERIQALKDKYPNMLPFLDYVDKHAALSSYNRHQEFWMPPTLLISPPGLGKTSCVKEVAAAIGIPFDLVDFSTTSASFFLIGSASSWQSSKPGLLYDMLIKQSNASNGLLLCDEIDKSMSSEERYPPINVFYRLLEKDIMREYQDEFIPQLKLDASRIMFIATANSEKGIPDAILSRFVVIRIEKPGSSQLKAIAKSIYNSIIESESYQSFASVLKDEVIDCLLGYSPRKIKAILKLAFASAAYRVRNDKTVDTITIETEDLVLPDLEPESQQIGFIWN